ncbi:hypothetical protein [Burkholderia vietnamiensis]|uniref:hypothetical protein n=1 Tax=Burkholderia vietnamiensis TaxID=60552 RepID=UPI00201240CC|nr:hypothetical protein [Burkholderia vietnamiensis]
MKITDYMLTEKQMRATTKRPAIEALGDAISNALDNEPASDVLAVLTGAFVSLTLELLRRKGHDVNNEIKIDGGRQRDITIHTPKEKHHG